MKTINKYLVRVLLIYWGVFFVSCTARIAPAVSCIDNGGLIYHAGHCFKEGRK